MLDRVCRKLKFAARSGLAQNRTYLLPAAIAGVFAICFHFLGAFQIVDGLLFDRLSIRPIKSDPNVVIVEKAETASAPDLARESLALGARQVIFLTDPNADFSGFPPNFSERVKLGYLVPTSALAYSSFDTVAQPELAGTPERLPRSAPIAEYGIYRAFPAGAGQPAMVEASVADVRSASDRYYIPMPENLSFAVLSSEQIMSGNLAAGDLEEMIVLVATPGELRSNRMTTPLSPDLAAISPAQFSAYAMQAFLTNRVSTKLSLPVAAAFILGTAMLCGFKMILTRKRMHLLLLSGAFAVCILVSGWVVFDTAGRIIPFGGMLTALIIAAFGTLVLQERRKDLRLERALVPAIEQTVSHTAFRNRDSLPDLFTATVATAGVAKMLLLRSQESGRPDVLASIDAEVSDLDDTAFKNLAKTLDGTPSVMSTDAADVLSDWPGDVRLRTIGSRHEPFFWLYTFGNHPEAGAGEFIASSIAQSFFALQKSHASLSAQQRGLRAVDPVDFRVVNAIELIARHGRQLRKATDQLHSAVMVFDVVGFPIHANPQMIDLLEATDLNPQTALMHTVIESLTELTDGQAQALLRDVLREGGEASATIQGIPGLSATLRISSPDPAVSTREHIVVLEVFDTTELARLSDLRRAIGEFVDVQMRNDLETIALGAALARKSKGNEERRLRMIDKIVQATQTATNRLDSMNELARNVPVAHEFTAHPIQLAPIAEKVRAKLLDLAASYEVPIEFSVPRVSGYSVGDPFVLSQMMEALLRLVIVDSPPESTISVTLMEEATRSHIRISGGFGMARERLEQALAAPPRNELPEFQTIKESALAIIGWGADFFYESETGKGYVFDIVLRRIV